MSGTPGGSTERSARLHPSSCPICGHELAHHSPGTFRRGGWSWFGWAFLVAAAGSLGALSLTSDHTFLGLALVVVGVAILLQGMAVDRILRAASRSDCTECPPPPMIIDARSKFCHNPHATPRTRAP